MEPAGGFVIGAGNAWMGGSSFGGGLGAGLNGGAIGGITGGILGGLMGGSYSTEHGGKYWSGKGATFDIGITGISSAGSGDHAALAESYNSSEYANSQDELLKIRMNDTFGVREGDIKIRTITTKSGNYGMTTDGYYVNSKGEVVGGYVMPGKGSSDVHISLGISSNYSPAGNIHFRAIAGHELIHAYHYSVFGEVYRDNKGLIIKQSFKWMIGKKALYAGTVSWDSSGKYIFELYSLTDKLTVEQMIAAHERSNKLFLPMNNGNYIVDKYVLNIKNDNTYKYKYGNVVITEGTWSRKDNILILFDTELKHNFHGLIGDRSITAIFLPGGGWFPGCFPILKFKN